MVAQYKADPETLKRLCEDAKFCRNLLSDFCPGPSYKRQRELLVAVVADQGAAELYQSQNSDLDEAAVRRLIARMVDDHGFTDQAVTWAVESWILALGLYDLFPGLPLIAEEAPLTTQYLHESRPPVDRLGAFGDYATGTFDVFICHRWETEGEYLARAVHLALWKKNIRAFLARADLPPGPVQAQLLRKVAETPTFLVVLSKNSLDRCAEPGDWVRQEIAHALKAERNVIPLMASDFEFPQELPRPIRKLSKYGPRLRYSHELFDQVIDRIVRIVEEQRQIQRQQEQRAQDSRSKTDSVGFPPRPGPFQESSNLWGRFGRIRPLFLLLLASAAIVAVLFFVRLGNPGPPDYSNFTRLDALSGHHEVECIAFSPDGKSLVTGNSDKTVTLWHLSDHQPKDEDLSDEFYGAVVEVIYSPDGKTLGILERDSRLITKDLAGAGGGWQTTDVISFAFSPDGNTVAGLQKGGTVFRWDTKSKGSNQTLSKYLDTGEVDPKENHPAPVNLVAYSPDGKSLAAGVNSYIIIWDANSGESKLLNRHSGWVNSLSFSPDGKTVASGGHDYQIIIWDVATGEFTPLPRQDGPVSSVAFLPDTKRLIFWSDSKTLASIDDDGLKLWEVGDWNHPKDFPQGKGVKAFAFSPGRNVLALARGTNIEIWGKQQ